MTTEFPDIQTLLPHRGQMALLSQVLQFAPPALEAQARLTGDGLFADVHGDIPAWIGIELMAQAAAAYIGLLARQEGRDPPQAGYLLGTRKFAAQVNGFTKNVALRVRTEMVYRDDAGLAAFDCKILQHDTVIATATINVYEPPAEALKLLKGAN